MATKLHKVIGLRTATQGEIAALMKEYIENGYYVEHVVKVVRGKKTIKLPYNETLRVYEVL